MRTLVAKQRPAQVLSAALVDGQVKAGLLEAPLGERWLSGEFIGEGHLS
jgi:hypothetical protein